MKNKTAFVITGIVAVLLVGLLYFRMPRKIRFLPDVINASLCNVSTPMVTKKDSFGKTYEVPDLKTEAESYGNIKEEKSNFTECLKDIKLYPSIKGLSPFSETITSSSLWYCNVFMVLKRKDGQTEEDTVSITLLEDGDVWIRYPDKNRTALMTLGPDKKKKAEELRDRLLASARKYGEKTETEKGDLKMEGDLKLQIEGLE